MKIVFEGLAYGKKESDLIAEILTTNNPVTKNIYKRYLTVKQRIYSFENGYGVSVVYNYDYIGGCEIVLIKFIEKYETYKFVNKPISIHKENVNLMLEKLKRKSKYAFMREEDTNGE